MKKVKLNLGCGHKVLKGFVNHDIEKNKGVDIVHDLNKFPYPWNDNEFEVILMSHVLEHVMYPEKTMSELYRILKKGGKLIIIFPHYTHPNVWLDLDHKRAMTEDTFRVFYFKQPGAYDPKTPRFSKFSYKYVPTKYGKLLPYKSLRILRHFCNILILDVEVTLTK